MYLAAEDWLCLTLSLAEGPASLTPQQERLGLAVHRGRLGPPGLGPDLMSVQGCSEESQMLYAGPAPGRDSASLWGASMATSRD